MDSNGQLKMALLSVIQCRVSMHFENANFIAHQFLNMKTIKQR